MRLNLIEYSITEKGNIKIKTTRNIGDEKEITNETKSIISFPHISHIYYNKISKYVIVYNNTIEFRFEGTNIEEFYNWLETLF